MAGDSDDEARHNTRHSKVKSLITQERQSLFDDLAVSLSKELSASLKETLTADLSADLTCALSASLTSIIKESIDSHLLAMATKVSHLEETITSYQSSLETITTELGSLKQSIDTHDDEIRKLITENDDLKKQMCQVAQQSGLERIDELEELIEERTNRSLRQTLVFKGVQQNGAKESWNETKSLLSDIIAETLDINHDHAMSMVNRCHRGGRKPRVGPKLIYANLFSWEDCEVIIEAFRRSNIQDSSFGIYANYKYGRLTTARRNMALETRKTLKSSGQITQGYLQYPAKLIVKYQGETVYREHENFSKTKVTFTRDKT